MKKIKAIGFDLFNTLMTVEPQTLQEANARLVRELQRNGFIVEPDRFKKAHRDAALRHLEECKKDGRETHNRFWIRDALETQGYHTAAEDPRIAEAVEGYFSAFLDYCRIVPGTVEMLTRLKPSYRLGLLTNFTHGPAARRIIEIVGLTPHFDVILISGELGFRKPHPSVFRQLLNDLGVSKTQIIYVGDDMEPDIIGAKQAGLQPVWSTLVRDHEIPYAPGVLSPWPGIPDVQVPRISTWQDLLSLLERE